MSKKKFYVYQEDLIRYRVTQDTVTISQIVKDLNIKFSHENMQKLRTETIANYLTTSGFLFVSDNGKKDRLLRGKY